MVFLKIVNWYCFVENLHSRTFKIEFSLSRTEHLNKNILSKDYKSCLCKVVA